MGVRVVTPLLPEYNNDAARIRFEYACRFLEEEDHVREKKRFEEYISLKIAYDTLYVHALVAKYDLDKLYEGTFTDLVMASGPEANRREIKKTLNQIVGKSRWFMFGPSNMAMRIIVPAERELTLRLSLSDQFEFSKLDIKSAVELRGIYLADDGRAALANFPWEK